MEYTRLTGDLNIKKLYKNTVVPTKGSEYAAGMDLYAYVPGGAIEVSPGETIKIGTGVAMEIPEGCFGAVFARSGLATKCGIRPANCVGVVDSDYRGEVIVAIHNDSDECALIRDKDRIAQLVIVPYVNVNLHEVEELSDTNRGDNGFGSTGK